MATAATIETGTSIVALVEATPVVVLTDKQKFSEFYEAMRAEVDAHVPDLTTEKGRKEIASLAYKVARTKTAIDEAGKKLNEEARARINAVDEARREIRKQLDELKDEVRRPLTEWEEAEDRRQQAAQQEVASIHTMQRVDFDDTADSVGDRLAALRAMTIDPDLHQAGTELAEAARDAAIAKLADAHARLVREEEERAELARLRAEKEEREARERQEREAAEAKAREEAAAREAEERRLAAEKVEQERLERVAREAEERAKAEAERKAQEEREAERRAHEEALAAERRRAEEAEAAAQAERDRLAAAEAERQRIADEEAAEQRRREADRAHRGRIMGEAKQAIMTCGIDEPVAKAVVLAIAAGNVPHVSIKF
jgi:colicin import membrane protein